jgi:hypothetical protein
MAALIAVNWAEPPRVVATVIAVADTDTPEDGIVDETDEISEGLDETDETREVVEEAKVDELMVEF